MRAPRYRIVALALVMQAGAHAGDQFQSQDFATCAAYYFLNSHVSQMTDYERLYRSGERALNAATLLSDRHTAQADFDHASNDMMTLMNRDWMNFGRVESKFGRRCDELMSRALDYPAE